MSAYEHPIYSYGLLVYLGELEEAAKRAGYEDEQEFATNQDGVFYFYETCAEASVITPNEKYYESSSVDVPEEFYMFELERFPQLFNQAYQNYDEALNELKRKYADILPKDFDFENRFVYLTGTICC